MAAPFPLTISLAFPKGASKTAIGGALWSLPEEPSIVGLNASTAGLHHRKMVVPSPPLQRYSSRHRDEPMMKDQQVRKQVFVRHLGSPLVLAPLLLGMTSLTAAWAFDWKTASMAAFAGVAGLLASGGIFLTRLILGGEQTAATVIREMEAETIARDEERLDRLEHALESSDNDPRPEKALRDLRALVDALKESAQNPRSHHLATLVEIHAQVNELFEHCVELLEQTIQLWQTAASLNTPAAQHPILQQRERLIEEIQQSVEQVSHTLVGLKQLSGTEISSDRLKQMRAELDQSLNVARTVEARVSRMMREAPLSEQ